MLRARGLGRLREMVQHIFYIQNPFFCTHTMSIGEENQINIILTLTLARIGFSSL